MGRLIKWLVVAIVAAVLLVAGFLAWYVFGDSAPAKPKLAPHPATERGGPKSVVGAWHIVRGKNVYVGYRIKELFGDATIKRDAVGRTPAVSGGLVVAGSEVTTATVQADVRQLTSSKESRDAYVRDNALDSNRFPTARFTLSRPIALPTTAKGKLLSVNASGSLLLHGVTRPITITLQARWDGPVIEVAGTAPIRLADFGIKAPHTVIASVDDHGSLELDLRYAPGR